jgi:hypothetical protein
MEINIKLNEEFLFILMTKMDKHGETKYADNYYNRYINIEMSKGINEFQASVKFLMDEDVPQKYKDTYRKNQNQTVEAMDLDDFPERPKLIRS